MRLIPTVIALFVLAVNLTGQRHKLTINAETPEGQLLQAIGQENDAAKKTALMEDFAQKHPKHEGVGWVLEQLVAGYAKANDFDKVLATGQKLLAIDPDDVATAHTCLKAAEGKKDSALVIQWAGTTSKLARKAAAAPKPSDEEAAEHWKNSVDYAKQVDTYTEYSLYAAALGASDNNQKIALYEALEAQNPKNQYIGQLSGVYFLALQATNKDKALAFAEKTLATDQSNEDMLLVVVDSYFTKKTNPDQVIAYGTKLGDLMSSKPKPQGVADADWEKRKNLMSGLGYWYAGVTYGNQSKYAETDATLRKALPLVQDNDQLKSQALFYLGLANYKMGEPKRDKKYLAEALRFNQQCAAIKGPLQGQAAKNAAVIRQQLGVK